jgi:hypothetical protein
MNHLATIFWYAIIPLQGVLLYFLVRNHYIRKFPFFFGYTSFSILSGIGRFALKDIYKPYLYFYWITEAMYALFGVAVLHEVYRAVFGNLKHAVWFRAIFPIAVVLTLALTILHVPGLFSGKNSLFTIITASEMGVRLLQVALFLVLICLVALFGLRWRQQAFGVSAGYGIYASVSLLASTKLYEIGSNFEQLWGVATVMSYTLAVAIWLWYFSHAPEPVKQRAEQPPLSAHDLEQYREAMQKVQKVRQL